MTYEVPQTWVPGTVKMPCGVCGVPARFPDEFVQGTDKIWRCKRFCGPEETLLDRQRVMAASRRLREAPPPPQVIPIVYTQDMDDVEGMILSLLRRCGTKAWEVVGTGSAVGSTSTVSAVAEACRYLYDLITEAKRPSAVLAEARALLVPLADWLLTQQSDSGGGQGDFGGFAESSIHVESYYTVDAAACGLAMCRAYQLTGADKYLTAAKNAATFLRSMQCSGWLAAGPNTTEDAAGLIPWHRGGMAAAFAVTDEPFTHAFYPDSLAAVEFLEVLRGLAGDVTAGHPLTPGQWAQDCRAPLSQMVSELRAYWVEAGTGFSASTPAEYFAAYPDGAGTWQKVDGTKITARRWATALRSLYAVDGLSTQVTTLYAYLMGFAADATTALPTTYSEKQTANCTLGPFSPKICLTTTLDVTTAKNGSQLYDWPCAGLLAGVQAASDSAAFGVLRGLGSVRFRYPPGLTDNRARDSLFLREYSGLSYQLTVNGSHGVMANDVYSAAVCGSIIRQAPRAYERQVP